MKKQVVLTVAESKRLIAKGVAALPQVQRAMKEGMLVVATGTTNAYVLQELWEKDFDLRRYRSGMTTPETPEKKDEPQGEPIPDVVFRKGEYANGMAGVLIGSPTGGTVGATLGSIIGKKIELVIPVGLEKLVYEDINDLHWLASNEDSEGPSMWPLTGTIITEIEALGILTGVEARLFAAGGVAGAEGAVRLLLDGTEEEVGEALDLVESIKGEPRYLL